jgi:anaerobic dimethyl sulfoxide reductase subunit C (anchor subunit)
MKEGSLVVFTIFAQIAVGAFITLCLLMYVVNRRAGSIFPPLLVEKTLLFIALVLGLSIIASLFHLGSPQKAWRAMVNLRSSWLSREVLLLIFFAGSGMLFMVLQSGEVGAVEIRSAVALATVVFGLILIYSMARVYMIRTIPSWNSWVTPVSFYVTAFVLGILVVGLVFSFGTMGSRQSDFSGYDLWSEILPYAMKWVGLGALLLLVLELIIMPFWVFRLVIGLAGTQNEGTSLFHSPGFFIGLRVILLFIGAGFILLFLYQNLLSTWLDTRLPILLLIAFFFVFTSEVIGRIIFYEARSCHEL